MEKEYDVIVAGGGIAGCCAAIAAARQNKKVLLIERYGFLGGMATAGLVNPFMKYNTFDKKSNIIPVNNTGIFKEILEKLDKRNSLFISFKKHDRPKYLAAGEVDKRAIPKRTFNEEVLKIILDEMTEEAGVEVLFHSFIFKVKKKRQKIISISTAGKAGVREHKAAFFIDATGDADVCAIAGCGFDIGREEDGKCQPMTLCFRIGNADPEKAEQMVYDIKNRKKLNAKYKEMQKDGKIKNQRENILIFPHVGNGVVHFNSTRIIDRNPLDPQELSKAENEARKQVGELVEFFRENAEGFENCILLQTAPQIGIRESRRIKGRYKLTGEDIIKCVKFYDSIARGCYGIDIHSPTGEGTVIKHISEGGYYTIPYRSIIPEKTNNLLVAGRPISASHEAHSAMRVMPICANIGESAGIAASICIDMRIKTKNLKIGKLHEKLKKAARLY